MLKNYAALCRTLVPGMHSWVLRMHSYTPMISLHLLFYIVVVVSAFLSKITSLEPSDHSLKLASHSLCLAQFIVTCSLAFRFFFFSGVYFLVAPGKGFIEHSGKGTC